MGRIKLSLRAKISAVYKSIRIGNCFLLLILMLFIIQFFIVHDTV